MTDFTKADLELILASLEAVNVPGKITEIHAALKAKVVIALGITPPPPPPPLPSDSLPSGKGTGISAEPGEMPSS